MSGVQKGARVRLSESGLRKWPHGSGLVFRVTDVRWCHASKCQVIYAVEPTFGMPWEFLPQDVEEARNG